MVRKLSLTSRLAQEVLGLRKVWWGFMREVNSSFMGETANAQLLRLNDGGGLKRRTQLWGKSERLSGLRDVPFSQEPWILFIWTSTGKNKHMSCTELASKHTEKKGLTVILFLMMKINLRYTHTHRSLQVLIRCDTSCDELEMCCTCIKVKCTRELSENIILRQTTTKTVENSFTNIPCCGR